MSRANIYTAPRTSRASRAADNDGEVDIPSHAHLYLDSIRKGSPVIPLIICYILSFVLLIGGLALAITNASGTEAERMSQLVMAFFIGISPMILGLIFAIKMIYRLSSVMQLDERAPSMSPTLSTVLFFVPIINIVGQILFILKVREHYARIVDNYGLRDAPQIGAGLLIITLVCSFLSMVPLLNLLALPVCLICSLILLYKFHKTLNYFAVRL
ncbi:MAG: hypothetical protein RL095_783 [Verrucomicrobiota bacterium]|jgi:hypothetical protein